MFKELETYREVEIRRQIELIDNDKKRYCCSTKAEKRKRERERVRERERERERERDSKR